MENGEIIKVSGPLVEAVNMKSARMYDVVYVGRQRLVGEVIRLRLDRASIQVYEDTSGLGPGDPVFPSGGPLAVELGPGLLTSIFDGIQRPLDLIARETGSFIRRGVNLAALPRDRRWDFTPAVRPGDKVTAGDVLGTVPETELLVHKILVPPETAGEVLEIAGGSFGLDQPVGLLRTPEGQVPLKLMHTWPVRRPRPYLEKLRPEIPLVTGQRVVDTLFPVAKGGSAAIPGPFGAGKTVFLHQVAKWADSQVIVYIGCGERGNEMADVLLEFPNLKDPRSGRPLMDRTVLIANTSNMPVAAREASIYTGITIAEYYRDMGYDVALMADSTSRWAEALREISGRMEEMPGEEGYPAYLGTRLAAFYERSGRVKCLGSRSATGSLSVVGAVSPPGGDLNDPVVQMTLRAVKVFWALDDQLAYQRHFPAINWLSSYSLYLGNLEGFLGAEVAPEWPELRRWAMGILGREAELKEIIRLIGTETLSLQERLLMDTARSLREDFLHQFAFDENDAYATLQKQYLMLKTIALFHQKSEEALSEGVPLNRILGLPVREQIVRNRYVAEDNLSHFHALEKEIVTSFEALHN
ncbi:MAG TPA: V-type ATP synthase subunit A [bacterium]|uniref:V-type ATP synthase alpha chain n=1 Tax=candidate division TA06 bacterium ADurb.Bin417 TaxID=1852828 RepID=A0A1V5MJW4_UNCT6|nr:MAG: V-type sodium ATPase catalytic subunit A [candidate division TA06 bacterium ADurb.Bin417]HNQ36052.1 V-type ATP synthase subunit A [bacterium]HNS48080.1 V-type ATP synthase subunit A [bacterium]